MAGTRGYHARNFTGLRWLSVVAGVAAELFVELAVFICIIGVKYNLTSSAPNRASRGVLRGRVMMSSRIFAVSEGRFWASDRYVQIRIVSERNLGDN